jgi:hypothetical protein
MRTLAIVLFLLGIVVGMSACGHAETELGNVLGCHLAGNGCPSFDPNDPNLRGPRGYTGAAGADGTNGQDGDTGPQGVPGLAGADGTIVRTVKLCPGETVYPSVFVEEALCINGDLYAVYSANGGFLTRLAPGNYSSNAIGSRCNLQVLSNCEIRN